MTPRVGGRPSVTVVVPTQGARGELLTAAIDSVWAQEGVDVGVVLVVDGPEVEPLPEAIAGHPLVEVVRLPEQRGQRRALDAGIARVRAPWVAFLDDDDVWHDPSKLLKQHAAATELPTPVIVSSRVLLSVNGRTDRVAPPRVWQPGDDVGEFAFCTSWHLGAGLIQQSTLFLSTELARSYPFSASSGPHPDIGLVLQSHAAGVRFVQLPEALSTWRVDDGRAQMSTSRSWRETLAWCEAHKPLLTRCAYAGALLTAAARASDARRGMPAIWRHACRDGRPRTADLAASLYLAYVPRWLRRLARRVLMARIRPRDPKRPEKLR